MKICKRWMRCASVSVCAVVLSVVLGLSGCSYYSFSGASIPSNLETIAIPLAVDNTVSPVPTLGRDLTDLLSNRFVGRTRLSLTTNESNADALLSVRITRYTNEPRGVTGDERASLNRVTVRVEARYLDQTTNEELLERSFSGFGDYDPVEDGLDGERVAVQQALERLADDLFSAATSNW